MPLFNQYAGPNQPLTNEINSFDQYDGHPQQTSMYHYHVEPYALTAVNGKDSLIGYLLDGFPVYGPLENGVTLTSANLDTYHGHFGATADYPGGIYHYHITADAPVHQRRRLLRHGRHRQLHPQRLAHARSNQHRVRNANSHTRAGRRHRRRPGHAATARRAHRDRVAFEHGELAALAAAAIVAIIICGSWYSMRR